MALGVTWPPAPPRPRRRAPAGPDGPSRPWPRCGPAAPTSLSGRDVQRRGQQGAPGARRGPRPARPASALSGALGRAQTSSAGHFAKCSPGAPNCVPIGAAERGVPGSWGPPGQTAGSGHTRLGIPAGAGAGRGAGSPGAAIHCGSQRLVPERGCRLLRVAPTALGHRGGGSARSGVGSFRPGAAGRCVPAGEATRRPHPARAPCWLGAPRELGQRDPWGRGAARRQPEGKASRARGDFPRPPDPASDTGRRARTWGAAEVVGAPARSAPAAAETVNPFWTGAGAVALVLCRDCATCYCTQSSSGEVGGASYSR